MVPLRRYGDGPRKRALHVHPVIARIHKKMHSDLLQPTKSKSKEDGATVVWDRYGDGCAYIIRNMLVKAGFKSWDNGPNRNSG
jgi:hypothetical protein